MGLLIVDKATGQIHSHRVPAIGNVPPLTFENCFPPWERDAVHERYVAYSTPYNYSTQEARDNLRVVAGQVCHKPTVTLKGQAQAKEGEPYLLTVVVIDTLPAEEFAEVRIEVAGVKQSIPLVDNQAEVPLVFELAGEYKIKIVDDRFRPVPPLTVLVLEQGVDQP
jgi:hypothetical protein